MKASLRAISSRLNRAVPGITETPKGDIKFEAGLSQLAHQAAVVALAVEPATGLLYIPFSAAAVLRCMYAFVAALTEVQVPIRAARSARLSRSATWSKWSDLAKRTRNEVALLVVYAGGQSDVIEVVVGLMAGGSVVVWRNDERTVVRRA